MFSDAYTTGLVFSSVAVVAATVGHLVTTRSGQDRKRVVDRLREQPEGPRSGIVMSPVGRSRLAKGVRAVGSLVASREKAATSELRNRLVYAGYFHPSAVPQFVGLRLLLTVGLAVVGGLLSLTVGAATMMKVGGGAVAGGAIGFLLPPMVLASQVGKRQRYLNGALPDAIDIMVMCVECGVSLNAAIDWVTDEIQSVHPVLGAELAIVRREMQLGLTAGDAFRHFADRSGVVPVRDLAAVLIQSERHGASVGKALRAYADTARQERQMWAEEMSQKAAVKIVFPTLLCIFPAMFTVLLGPAAFQMAKLFAR